MDMSKKNIEAMVKKLGSIRKVAKHFLCSRHKIDRILGRPHPGGSPVKKVFRIQPAEGKIQKKPLSKFRELHDRTFIVPRRIKEALKRIGNGWEYEREFCSVAGVSTNDIAAYREQFKDHVVQIERSGKRAWTGSKAMAVQMRKMV
jgi:hypothetical protein